MHSIKFVVCNFPAFSPPVRLTQELFDFGRKDADEEDYDHLFNVRGTTAQVTTQE